MIIQQAGRLLDLQAYTPLYQLASRSVRIRNRPLGATETPGALPNSTSVHQYTSALLQPPGRPAEAAQNQIPVGAAEGLRRANVERLSKQPALLRPLLWLFNRQDAGDMKSVLGRSNHDGVAGAD